MSSFGAALHEFEDIVGAEHLVSATGGVATLAGGVSEFAVDGQMPFTVAHPGTEQQVAELVRVARAHGLSILPRGGGQHLYLGNVPAPIGLLLSLDRLAQVVEYDADDLTITVQAGLTVGAVQRVVGAHQQMLPVDPPHAEQGTIGGLAAANVTGPLRMSYGARRDLILGLRVATSDGEFLRTGARTVKNVAGYDLTKLFVGSFGSLGALLEVTLRLVPQPESRALFAASLSPARAREVAAALLGGALEVTTCDVLNYAAAADLKPRFPVTLRPDQVVLFIGVMGASQAVARQEREFGKLLPEGLTRLDHEDLVPRLRDLDAPFAGRSLSTSPACLRLRVPLTATLEMMDAVSARDGWKAVARAGDGVVYAIGPADIEGLRALRETAHARGGHAVLEDGPVELKRAFGVWGELPNLDLLQALKHSLDPTGLFGCARLVPQP